MMSLLNLPAHILLLYAYNSDFKTEEYNNVP